MDIKLDGIIEMQQRTQTVEQISVEQRRVRFIKNRWKSEWDFPTLIAK
jgi:hypothetical protein